MGISTKPSPLVRNVSGDHPYVMHTAAIPSGSAPSDGIGHGALLISTALVSTRCCSGLSALKAPPKGLNESLFVPSSARTSHHRGLSVSVTRTFQALPDMSATNLLCHACLGYGAPVLGLYSCESTVPRTSMRLSLDAAFRAANTRI